MIDITKPMRLVDGRKVYDVKNFDYERYVLSIEGEKGRKLYTKFGVHYYGDYPNLENYGVIMPDFNKPLVVNDKDAKIIHTFDNGNMAVIIEGEDRVYTFEPSGQCITYSYGNYQLENKAVETVRFLNIDTSNATSDSRWGAFTGSHFQHPTFESADQGRRCNGNLDKDYSGFIVKQTLIGAKVVKNEIVG